MINFVARRRVPFSQSNNLLTHGVMVFASHPAVFASTDALLAALQAFVHPYRDVTDGLAEIARTAAPDVSNAKGA